MEHNENDNKGSQVQLSCCSINSMVTVDERGQMVLPKEVREKAKIKAGERMAVVSLEQEGEVSCLLLLKSSEFEKLIKKHLEPIVKNIFKL